MAVKKKPKPLKKEARRLVERDSVERWDAYEYDGNQTAPKTELADFMALYAAHPWVYACVNAIATAAASVRFRILKNGEEVKDEKILHIFKKPNPHMTWFEMMEATICYSELTGNCFWEEVYKGLGAERELLALYPLRPDRMKIKPHPKHKIQHYRYLPSRGDEIIYTPDEITHLKYFNPNNEFWGIGPLAAAENGLIQDFWAVAFNKGFFKRGSEPGFVLETEESLGEQAYNRLLDNWAKRHQGADKNYLPAILEDGLKYKPISLSQKDMQFAETRRASREEVLGVFRVPPAIIGLLEFSNYATSREQKKTFWMDNVLVKLRRIEDTINATLMPGELEFRFITESITSLIEDEKVAAEIANAHVTHGVMTINEVRKKYLGLEGVPWGDVWWPPVGLAPYNSGAHPTTPGSNNNPFPQTTNEMETGVKGPAFVPAVPNLPDGSNLVDQSEDDFDKLSRADPDWNDPRDVWVYGRWQLWKQLATPDYRSFRQDISKVLSDQWKRIEEKIQEGDWPKDLKAEKALLDAIAHEREIAKADEPKIPKKTESWLLDLKEEEPEMKKLFDKKAQELLRKHGNTVLRQIGLRAQFDLKDEAVQKWVDKYAADRVSRINEVTREKMRATIAEAVKEGEGFDRVKRRLADVFKGPIAESRARAIARTEVVTLTNHARYLSAKQTGVVKKKIWISELLESTRDPHREIHGRTLGIDKKFKVKNRSGIDEMDGPGDPSASAENVVNCLCVLDFPPETEEFRDLFQESEE